MKPRPFLLALAMLLALAAWAGQERADVDRAVAIAPLLGVTQAGGNPKLVYPVLEDLISR